MSRLTLGGIAFGDLDIDWLCIVVGISAEEHAKDAHSLMSVWTVVTIEAVTLTVTKSILRRPHILVR